MKLFFIRLLNLLLCVALLFNIVTCKSEAVHDTEKAIDEIENHLKEIENDESLPASSEQEDYEKHFKSHQNSLDSVSDFVHGSNATDHSPLKDSDHDNGIFFS
jgi:hypothetical protein